MAKTTLTQHSKRDSLVPVSHGDRIFGLWSYIGFWISSTVVLQSFLVGQGFVPPNGALNFLQAITATVVACIIIALLFVVNSQPGMKYGIPFVVQARSAFGYNGARVASLIRVVPALFWYGIASWIGAQAFSYITETYWGWSNIWLVFIIFQIVHTVLVYYGIETAKWFNSLLSVVLLAYLIYFIVQLLSVGNLEIRESWQTEGSWGLPFFASVSVAVGIILSFAINNADISRYLKSNQINNWVGHFLGIIPTTFLLIFTGILAAAITGIWDPIEAIVTIIPHPGIAVSMLAFIVIAQVTTNITTNIIPPAMIFVEMFNMRWGIAVIIVGILSVVTFPWLLMTSSAFDALIGYISAFMGPLFGILVADFYLVRKRKLNVDHLYKGVMKYNWLGFVALAIGGIFGLIFVQISWMVSLPVSAIIYWAGYQTIPQFKNELAERSQETMGA